jgi:nicotinamide mononucleotide adenylyltransferase
MAKKIEIPRFLEYKYAHPGEAVDSYQKILPYDKCFGSVVTIMRANPPHINHTNMLRALCEKSQFVKVNLGSSNKFNEKNPFKIEEREAMIELALRGHHRNCEIKPLPDFGEDEQWFNHLWKINDPFTEIISNNNYDLGIYKRYQFIGDVKSKETIRYEILQPGDVFPKEEMLYVERVRINGRNVSTRKPMYVSGTFVRAAMVNDWNWEDFMDERISDYIVRNGLVDRIKKLLPKLKGIPLEQLEEDR